jgi:hypothetical protein
MKYELVKTDTKVVGKVTLYRIRALIAVGSRVAARDLGGYIEKEANLSQVGNAWVYRNARVFGDAQVSGNAQVSGDAWVYGNARVYGEAQVSGYARVSGNAQVYGEAQVSGEAWVYGEARVSGDADINGYSDWLIIGPAKSSGRFTTAYKDKKIGVRVSCGCFTGSVQEFSQQIENTHEDNKEHLEQYRLFCQLIAFNFGVSGT